MKMKLDDVLKWPKGMSLEEYQKLLTKIDNLHRKKIRALYDRDFLEDALDILSDEEGSDRWLRKKAEYDAVLAKIDKYSAQLDELEAKLIP